MEVRRGGSRARRRTQRGGWWSVVGGRWSVGGGWWLVVGGWWLGGGGCGAWTRYYTCYAAAAAAAAASAFGHGVGSGARSLVALMSYRLSPYSMLTQVPTRQRIPDKLKASRGGEQASGKVGEQADSGAWR